ncbi:MAG: DUF1015 domain-containing protein [Magnetococcales bacterium]|nr:DUF1015 domain-containing protein [Magnetococcales bacterium]
MTLIQPFAGWRPRLGWAARVAAPPYDVLSSAEARLLAQDNPDSFLHVSKAEINLDPALPPDDALVYQTAKERFEQMRHTGVLIQDATPCLYIYRLAMGERVQTGVVVAASVAAYRSHRIRKHELTRPDKENDRTRLADTLSAHSGPVFLIHRQTAALDDLVTRIQQAAPPDESFQADDGIQHSLWVVRDTPQIDQLVALFEQQSRLYIADGHHRSAAAERICTSRPTADHFLAVSFPDSQVCILAYNRVVRDLNGLTPAEFLKAVGQHFQVTPATGAVRPDRPHCFGLYVARQWYRLTLDPGQVDATDAVARLDVSLLDRYILQPILGIHDLRRDQRIDFVGGSRGTTALAQRVDAGHMAAAFSLFPTQLAELMAVADADQIMPPKSTWFEPKLRDGLVVQTFA